MKARLFGAMALIMASALLFAGCKKEDDKTYENALKDYAAGQYAQAAEGYKLAISQGENNPVIYADMALAYSKMEQVEEAMEYLKTAQEQAPNDKGVLKRIGIFYMDREDFANAASYLKQALSPEPGKEDAGDLETRGFLADCYMQLLKFEDAVPLYNKLIESDYYALEHIIRCGECYLKMHQFSAACQYFDMVEKESKAKASHYVYIFKACMEAGDYNDAANYFEIGKNFCGSPSMREMTLSEYYIHCGMLDVAREELKTEEGIGAGLAKAWMYIQDGDFTSADNLYKEIIVEQKNVPEIYSQYMALCILRGEYDNAVICLNRVKDAEADETTMKCVLWNEIILYERKQEYETALDKLEAFKTRFGNDESVTDEILFLERVLKKE